MAFYITINIQTSELKRNSWLWNHAPIVKVSTVFKQQFYESI